MTVSRLPQASDFPPSLNPIFHPSDASLSKTSNIILFLPGLGDTSSNFSSFPRALNLPDTLTVTLQPPHPLPFPVGPGFHWSDDLQFDPSNGTIDDTESGFRLSLNLLEKVINEVLMTKCGFQPHEIHLYGYGQGGSLAISVLLQSSLSSRSFGGVISCGGPLPLSTPLRISQCPKNPTPILVTGGSNGQVFKNGDDSRVKRVRDHFTYCETVRWKKSIDSMPASREEVLPLMEFWSRRLRSRRGVPEGAVDIA